MIKKLLLLVFFSLIGYKVYYLLNKNQHLQTRVNDQAVQIETLEYQLKMCKFLYRKCGG